MADEKNVFPIPKWSCKPPAGSHLDVSKNEIIVEKLLIDEKGCYYFGRNPTHCDFVIEHASSSRVHAVLLYHGSLQKFALVDLKSSHGTFVKGIRIQPLQPVFMDFHDSFFFGASTRRYFVRPRVTAPDEEYTNSGGDGLEIKLPQQEYELDNLTSYNTMQNRRVAAIPISLEEARRKSRPRGNVAFLEEEEVINPEDVDPSIGRFRNLIQTALVGKGKRKNSGPSVSNKAAKRRILRPGKDDANDTALGSYSSVLGPMPISAAPNLDLYAGIGPLAPGQQSEMSPAKVADEFTEKKKKNESEWNDRQIVEELLKRYRFPDPSTNISVGVSVRLERLLDSNEDLCNIQLLIRQKWMESKLNYEHIRHSEIPVRLRSLDYIWSPALVIENALSVLNVGKNIINVYANGIVEFEQSVQILVPSEGTLWSFPFEQRNCSILFSNDDGRAVWNRLLTVEIAENLLLRPMEWRFLGSRAPDSKSLLLILRRSINRWIGTLFLPSLGLVVVGWFGSWFFKSDDRRRLQIQIAASLGILFLVFLTQQYVPKTAFLKAIDFWCLTLSGVALLNLLLVIGTTASVSHTERRRPSRTPYDPESDKARWIVADTPYYSQLAFHRQKTVCRFCLSIGSVVVAFGFALFIAFFGITYVMPYYRTNKQMNLKN